MKSADMKFGGYTTDMKFGGYTTDTKFGGYTTDLGISNCLAVKCWYALGEWMNEGMICLFS